jgi:hypothetical protein
MCDRLTIVSIAVLVWLRQHLAIRIRETITLYTILSHKSYSVLALKRLSTRFVIHHLSQAQHLFKRLPRTLWIG